MSISLYQASVGSYLQLIEGVLGVLDKGVAYCQQQGINPDELLNDTLSEEMLPLSFQLRSVVHHSLGCIKGLEKGLFQPPVEERGLSFDTLYQRIAAAKAELEVLSPEAVDALAGKPMLFKMGDFELPFSAENFVLSFSLPNFYFHTTTVYDLLRKRGVKLGKVDFLGPMQISQ